MNYTKLICIKKKEIPFIIFILLYSLVYILSNQVYGSMKFPQFSKPESQWAITSVDVHSLDILISGPIIPSVFSTLQFQQQDLIKGLYFNLSTLPVTYPPLQVRSSSFSKLCSSLAGRMRSSIPGVILFSINFFSRTAIATHGWLHAGEPDNRNWSLSEETTLLRRLLRERSLQINPCNYGADRNERISFFFFLDYIFFKMWNYLWRNGDIDCRGLIETRREIIE